MKSRCIVATLKSGQATAGVELIDSNGPIRAYYSATNGGYTETAAYVFNNDVPYTVAGPDPYDAGGHDWTQWTRTYTQESMSRWLNARPDTAVGTVTSINVGGGAGASSRIDKAVVEIVGTQGTKRVTGKRLMLVINAGVFGEGGGLSTHLPGTFTTVGNGAGAGWPVPSGVAVPITVAADPVVDGVSENEDFTPPPGWVPEPGTGVAPRTDASEVAEPADETADEAVDAAELGTVDADGTYTPPEGWVPEPGTGVAPGATTPPAPAETDASAADSDAEIQARHSSYTPPPGWVPEAGTGVAPNTTATTANTSETIESTSESTSTDDTAFTPPADWQPEPGTGVAPRDDVDTETVGGTGGGYTPPAGWQPEPGTGVAPSAAASSASSSSTSSDDDYVGGTGGGDATASGVLLVTRTADGTELADATFEVIAPTADLAAEARGRLHALQARAALGLFADVDIDGYVASVAPRPVHGVCTATVNGVTCVPLQALQD